MNATHHDYKGPLMELDFSKNNVTESSLKYLADILRKFHGIKELNLQSLPRMRNDSGWIDLCRALKETRTLQKLDLSKNSLSGQVMAELYQAIQDNFVISEVKIEIKGKSIPFGFSTYPLMSMYQLHLTQESVDL